MVKRLTILPLVACIGCIPLFAPTPYQRFDPGPRWVWEEGEYGGYDDYQVRPGVYFIEVQGNSLVNRTRLVSYFHRRAGELCRQAGFQDYAVTSEKHETERRQVEQGKTYKGDIDSFGTLTLKESGGGHVTITSENVSGYVVCHTAKPDQVKDSSSAVPGKGDPQTKPAGTVLEIAPRAPARKLSGYCKTVAFSGDSRVYCYPTLEECLGAPCVHGSQGRCNVLAECELVGE